MSGSAAAHAATYSARSVALADVQSAIDRATDGDTVVIPAGKAPWNSTLTVTKNIIVQGAGVGRTVIVDSVGSVVIAGQHGRKSASLIDVQLSKDHPLFRVTGMEFEGAGAAPKRVDPVIRFRGGSSATQKPLVVGTTSNFRLDHCKFNNLPGMPVVFSNLLGVVDHVEYEGRGDFCFVQHPNWGGADLGHGSWADDPYWGSNKFLFFEDCDFTNTGTGVPYGFDAYLGARYVVRHCRFHGNTGITGHGTETPQRGTKQIEIYHNSFDFPEGLKSRFPQLRSGSVIFHDNVFRNCFAGMSLRIYRQLSRYGAGWGHSTGRNKWDDNDPKPAPYAAGAVTAFDGKTVTDAQGDIGGVKNWTDHQFDGVSEGVSYIIKNTTAAPLPNGDPKQTFLVDNGHDTLAMGSVPIPFSVNDHYEVWKVKASLDQPGMGKGALLTGNVKNGNVTFAANGSAGSWPQKGFPREPCYSWNNINLGKEGGEAVQLNLKSEQHSVKEGRDYINYGDVGNTPQKIGPTASAYIYKPFPYPHPLQDK